MSTSFVRDMRVALKVASMEKQRVDEDHPDRVICYLCSQPDDFTVDEENRVYAMKLNDRFSDSIVRFKISKCSSVFFAAVNVPNMNVPHCGLVIENDFEVTQNDLLAHAMFV